MVELRLVRSQLLHSSKGGVLTSLTYLNGFRRPGRYQKLYLLCLTGFATHVSQRCGCPRIPVVRPHGFPSDVAGMSQYSGSAGVTGG